MAYGKAKSHYRGNKAIASSAVGYSALCGAHGDQEYQIGRCRHNRRQCPDNADQGNGKVIFVEKVICIECGSIGYTASPEQVRCSECGGNHKVIESSCKKSSGRNRVLSLTEDLAKG